MKLVFATLDNRVTFKKMISLKCRIAMGNLQKLKRIRKYFRAAADIGTYKMKLKTWMFHINFNC